MNKKKNPRRHSIMRHSYQVGQQRYFADQSAYESTQSALDNYYPREAQDENSFEIYPELDGKYREYTDTEKGFLDKVGDFLFGDSPVSWTERLSQSTIKNIWNDWNLKRVGADRTSKEFELELANDRLDELKTIQQYSDLIKERQELYEKVKRGETSLENVQDRLNDIQNNLAELTAYFLTDGKKSNIVTDLLYNTNRIDWSDTNDLDLKLDVLGQDLTYNTNTPASTSQRFGQTIANLIKSGEQALLNLGDYISGKPSDRFVKRALQNSSPGNRLYDRLFVDYSKNTKDLDILDKRILNWRDYLERDKLEKLAEVIETENEYTQGSWLWDPRQIDPRYRSIQEQTKTGFLGWLDPTKFLMMIPETGSSWSDIKNFTGLMAVNYGAEMLGSLATLALTRNPEAAASVLSGIRLGAAGTTLGLTAAMRRHETNSEAMDAQSSKVLNESIKHGVDIESILNQTKDYSNTIGINTDGLSQLELLQLALAYNVPTNDPTFEKIKKDSRKGLSKVINENNALAAMDYLEALPFMNFTGSFFRDAASAFKPSKLRTATIYKSRGDGFYDYNTPVNKFRLLDRDELIEKTARRLDPNFEKAVDASFNGVLDRAITRVADKFGRDIESKLKWSHGLKFLKRKAQQLVPLATKEGIEEGQQQLLQSRYQRGEYEYYDKPLSMFDLPSLFNTPLLASEAVASYFGINFGDPDNGDEELRKAMEIGAISGALFRSGHILSNLVSDENAKYLAWIPGIDANDRNNIRSTINQLRNDSALRQIVGESLGKYEDDQHIGIFFDAFSKKGINAERLANSLNELKNFKGSLVTDDYIDEDIRLMNIAWNAYKNPELNTILKDLNITQDSEQHKDLIRLATRAVVDYQNVKKLLDQNDDQLNKFIDDILFASEDTEDMSEEQADYITSKRNSSLDAILRKIDESFDSITKLINQEKQAFVSSQEALQQAQERILNRRKEREAEIIASGEGGTIVAGFDPMEIAEEAKKIADEQFSIPSKQQYRRNRLTTLFNLSRIRNSEVVRDMLKLQQQRLSLLRDETGTDIDVDRLIGMIDALDRDIERMKSEAKNSMSDINEQIRKLNEIRENLNKSLKKKDRLPLLKEQTLDDVFAGYPQFENQDEIDKQQQLRALNNAVLQVLKPIAEAYVTGRTNPALVKQTQRTLKWSELSDSQRNEYKNKLIDEWQQNGRGVPTDNQVRMLYLNELKAKRKKFDELQKKFEKLTKELQSTPEEDRTFEMDADIDEVERQAALQLILFDLAQKAERRKVAHRLWQQDSPITPADTEAAMDGNEDAQRKIDDALNKIRKDETEDAILAQNSLDEQPSDSFVGDSKVDSDVFLPEDGQLGAALSEIMVDNAPETDAEKEAYKKLYGELPEKKKKKTKNNLEPDAKPLSNDSEPLLPNQDDSTESSLSDTVGSMPESTNIEILDENLNLNSEVVDEPYQNLIDKDPIDSNDILKEAGINTANTLDVDPSLNETELDSDEDGDNGSSREESDDDISEKNKNADQEEPLQEDLPAGNFPIDENEDGNLVIDGMLISDEVAEELIEEQDLLSMFGLSMNLDSNDFYANPESDDPRQLRSSEKAWTDYISQTFFYGYQEDVPPVLKVNGQELKLNKPLRSGKELSKKLSQSGWFKSAKKYYVVCGGIESNSSHNANDLTVALILEDSEACYATFLRTPDSIVQKQPNGVRMSGLEYIKSRLRFIGVDVEKYKHAIQDARELYYHNHKVRQPIDTGRIDQDELLRQIKKWQKDARKYYEELSLDNPELAKEKRLIEYDARRRAKIGVGDPLTEEQIQELINNLIEARNKIISAYCIKQQDGTYVVPTNNGYALTHVHPENPRISNGKFNTNPRTNGLPTFKKLTGKDGGFGLSEDLEELTKQLNDRDVEFGYGTGRNGENPYSIVDFIGGDGSIQYDGIGHSGKIYVMIEGPGGAKVPVMLREERFNRQEGLGFIHKQKDNLVLTIDPATGKMQPEKGLPSAAEVILYMITGKLNVDHMPADYADVMKPLIDLFVHNGEDTLMTINGNKQSVLNKFKFFADKRFAWLPFGKTEQYRLAIVTKNQLGNRIQKYYTAEELFGANSEATRREVIYTIAENMHWNTEKADMKEKMNPKILEALRTYFSTYKDATEFRICGLEQFSFKKSDLFELDKKGNIKRSKDISVFAWMLANGKILTDLQSDHFKDPFVFANGVKVDEDGAVKQVVELNLIPKKPKEKNKSKKSKDEIASVIDTTATIAAKQEEIERFKSRFGVRSKDAEALIAKSEENRQAILDQYNTSPGVQKHGGMRDVVVLDINPSEIKSANQSERASKLKEQLNTALSKYIKHLSDNGVQAVVENITISSDATSPQILKQVINNKIVPVLSMYNDGTGNVRLIQASELLGTVRGVTGVFSKIKTGGKLNQKRARTWLKNVLGLDDSQVIIENGVWKSASDELVYGITNVAVNALSDQFEFEGIIRLSKQGGRGVHYHEAWHYINLLLHSPKERAYIYRKYIESHPELKRATFKEIEEAMAEDFRKYMEMKNEYNISNILRRVGNTILNFINTFRGKQNEIQYIYESIRSGMYAKSTLLDDDSLNEFKRRFPNGVYQASYVIPGVPGHVIEKLTNITNPATFYQVGQSLAHKLIDRYDLKTIGDIKSVLSGLFRLFIEDLRLLNENDGNPLIDDIVNNPEAFKHIIYSMFKQYGIEPKFKRIKKEDVTSTNPENDSEDAQKAEDRAENVWDIDNLLISLKDNVAFRAKLFLSRQKKTHFAWDENGLRYLEEDYDTLLNTPMYLGYSETWVSILQNLWNIESFDKRDINGDFESSSMRGMVKRLALSQPFFAELDRRLDTLYDDEGNPDVELINQIYCTVKKSNPQVAFFELRDAIEKRSYFDMGDISEGETIPTSTNKTKADRNKEWALQNSNALRAVRNLPRQWSKTAMVSGMVTINDKGETVVNLNFVDALYEVLDNGEIWDYVTKPKRKKSNGKYPTTLDEMEDVYENVSNAIVKVLNLMGISSDREVFDYYIQKHLQNPNDFGNPEKRFQVLCQVLAKPSGQNAGSIRSILALLDDSVGYSEIRMSKGKTKPLELIYYGYKIDSEISKYAEAYNEVYPSASDFSVVGPDGSTIYPISENNHMSDELRGLNYDTNGKIESMQRSPYCLNSLILKLASEINHKNPTKDEMFKLNAFVGLKDSEKQQGKDYFGITPLEDYIAKMEMTFRNMIVLPTMADKKTWYAIEQKDIVLPHDLITYDLNSENGAYLARRFSNRTLNIFAGYFIDELNSLEQYYSRENILYLVNNPTKAIVNFHGAIKNGRMTFDGNGGKFRYFYEIQFMLQDYSGNGPRRYINLNQYLEFMYNKQKAIEDDPVSYGGLALLREQNNPDDELDGFELVRLAIKEIRSKFLSDTEESKKLLHDNINTWLMNLVDQEVYAVAQDGDLQIGQYKLTQDNVIKFASTAIPRHILDYYSKEFLKAGLFAGRMRPYYAQQYDYDFTLSAIANHVASTMISIIETEKIFTGDPAYYKWKGIKGKYAKKQVSIDGFVTSVSNLKEKHSDKIKRLGAVLSPGANLRTQYSEEEINNTYGIKGSKYTVMNISDITAKSLYINELKTSFGRQALVDHVRQNPPAWWNEYVENSGKKESTVISSLYRDDSEYEKLKDYAELHDAEFAALLAERTNMAIAPYNYDKSIGHKGITVSDAEVIIRPALYRKIRISLGEWTFTPDEDGYSDEEAYNIIESDPNWMYDEEKYKKVSKLELYPLKMTYFANGSRVISYNEDADVVNYQNVPVYNKMAIFPAFKFAFSSDTGRALYDRMNMSGNEIDMIAFESAVKVGDNLGKWSPFEDGVDNLDKLNDGLNSRSNQYIKDGEVLTNVAEDGENLLPILIQDLNGLRLQLNTESHTATERGLGTQAFKIMFSNIVDEDDYGSNKTDDNGNLKATRKGRLIKEDIMSCIQALTTLGVASVQEEFYDSSGKLKPQVVQNWVRRIAKNNGLGISAEEILSDGVVASLMSRKVFENGVSSLVNKEIVDINTTGGTAVQQSVFGFVGYGKRNVVSDEYYVRNNGENLKWNKYDGSMEVILTLNFFRHVVPVEYQNTPDRMRQWLIDHDVIKGTKLDGTQSNPKPFGIGYRIPTQGMSSTFSFTVADVLPLQSGDVIIVPMEFTAQTGSDFDVDKLFLCTKSYTDGELDVMSEDSEKRIKELFSKSSKNRARLITEILSKESHGAVLNRLIDNYIDIISDVRMFANARQSIDVITNLIQDRVLTVVNKKSTQYARAGYELLPSFLAQTKMEFSTGKSGIGPFALNITNMALTQFMHLTMDFGENEFEFGRLDAIQDLDGLRISDWLSAMVNAHVDVAKDPYVFALNVNKETYNHVNFLLRAGKGISTFTFIAQPILKKLARLRNTSGGLYGSNIDGKTKRRSKKDIYIQLLKEATDELNSVKDQINSDDNLSDEEKSAWRIRIANLLNNKVEISEWKYVFNTALGIYSILNPDTYRSKYMQLLALKAYDRIQKYADELSELVQVSLIDTKKFGNNIASLLNFKNRYELFKHTKRPVNWFIGNKPEKLDADVTTNAIARYFNTLFLDSKFYNATNYVRLILRKLTYTATEVYNDLFNSILGEINGVVEYQDYSGETKHGYNVVLDDDVVLAVGGSIDNIIRFRSLFKFGQSFKFRNKENDYAGPIDFTCGGNIDEVNQNIERILFGNKNSEDELNKHDLFTNLSQLIHEIQQDPSSDIATGLVDINGNIINQFLLFLRPQTADEKFSIGRMLLRKSQMDVAVEQKAMLISDFDILLRHPSEKVRRIARDIAFYAYYSTYDTSTTNSFFDLVPRYYRQLYDYALKNGLNCSNDILITALISDIFDNIDATSDARISESFLDLISRNYWYDDNIVPEYNEPKTSSKNAIHLGYDLKLAINYVQNQSACGIILARSSNNKPYIKIRKGDETLLYRKVGNLYRTNKRGTVVTDYAVYFIVPKLGLHKGKIHQYEFYNGSKIASAFEENDLPDVFSHVPFGKNKGLFAEFEEFFNEIKPNKTEQKQGITFKFESNPKIILEGFYYESIEMLSTSEFLKNDDSTIKFIPTSNIDNYLSAASDFIIDVNEDVHNNSVKINSNDSIETILSKIKEKLGSRNTERNPLKLYISGSFDPKVTKKEIKDYIESKIQEYLEKEENPNEAAERNRLRDIAEDEITKLKQDEFISNLIISMISSGIYIDRLFSDGQPNIGESVARVGSLLSDEFATELTDVVTIAVPKSFATNMEEYGDFISIFSNMESSAVMSQKERLGVVNMKNIIDQTNEVIDQLEQESLLIQDNIPSDKGDDLQGNEVVYDISLLLGSGNIVKESKSDIDAAMSPDTSDAIDNPENATDASDILNILGC